MFNKASLQTRFLGSISTVVVLFVLGGALIFSSLESSRITGELKDFQEQQLSRVVQILGVTDTLMSERTSRSTKEISDMIAGIQETTAHAISGIETGASLVNQSVGQANIAGASMQKISDATLRVVDTIGEISNALREQTTASELIANNVEHLAGSNEENSLAVQSVHDDAQKLQQLAGKLQQAVGMFRL